MGGLKKRDGDSEGDSGFITPDSTTKDSNARTSKFCDGEEVLSHGKDGLFYLGTIVVVNAENESCLIKFEDNTAHWSLFKDITKLRIPESDELCVVCKSSRSDSSNEIVLCSVCSQGYHQNCLENPLPEEFLEGDCQWECPRCCAEVDEDLKHRKKSSDDRTTDVKSPRKLRSSQQTIQEKDPKQALPYKLSELSWDAAHKTNKQQTYCYCGGPGEWYDRMLHCQRCFQWFHEACVECLHFPLLRGDRFYVFVCSLCNGGTEFVHRLHLKWVDVAHIALFNLSFDEKCNFKSNLFDLETNITRWVDENWEILQCPLLLRKTRICDRKLELNKVLQRNRMRFLCGKEMRKRRSHWRLRIQTPPPVPSVALPSDDVITEESVKHFDVIRVERPLSPPLPHLVKVGSINKLETPLWEGDSSRRSPNGTVKKHSSLLKMEVGDQRVTRESVNCQKTVSGASAYQPKRGRKRELDILMEDKKKMVEELKRNGGVRCRGNRPRGGRGVTHRKGANRPGSCVVGRGAGSLNGRGSTSNGNRDFGSPRKSAMGIPVSLNEKKESTNYRSMKSSMETWPHAGEAQNDEGFPTAETSGDDSSSRGTLDSFIPPPTDFEGCNHPFRVFQGTSYNGTGLTGVLGGVGLGLSGIPYPGSSIVGAFGSGPTAPVHASLIKPFKRKLKESDLRVDKNGRVKCRRRKLAGLSTSRRGDKIKGSTNDPTVVFQNGGKALPHHHLSSEPLMHHLARVSQVHRCLGENLPQLEGREINAQMHPEGLVASVGAIPPNYSDLRSTVTSYFGAASRLASGQKFRVLARRITESTEHSCVQYLIEWDSSPSSGCGESNSLVPSGVAS